MIKRLLFLIAITFISSINTFATSAIDTSYTQGLTAFDWTPISDADKIMQYENPKDLTKRAIDQAKLAADNYTAGVALMKNKEYVAAIKEFQAAMKRYSRAKLSPDAMNFINANMALSYANSGNKEDLAQAEKYLSLLTSKAYNDNKWAYNIAIANSLVGNQDEAASLLSSIIRKDEFNFQAYVTLEAIYRNSGNEDEAEVIATDFEGMVKEGEALAALHPQIVVKVPMIKEGIKAIKYFSDKGIRTNCTLVFSVGQALLAAKAGATYVSPFIGRLDDIATDGLNLIAEIRQVYDNYAFDTQILAASVRHTMHIIDCAKLGADVMTGPLSSIEGLLKHPLTDIGLAQFLKDYKKGN